jgi:hypothetical protein
MRTIRIARLAFLFSSLLSTNCLSKTRAEVKVLPFNRNSEIVDRLLEDSERQSIVLLGEEHREPRHSQMFVAYLRAMENLAPGRVKMVGLEVFDKYQIAIDQFLKDCDFSYLNATPDREALRGHKGDDVARNFLAVYASICEINRSRKGSGIKIIAMDHAPDSQMTFREWQDSHSMPELLGWAIGRDSYMNKNIVRFLSNDPSDLSIVFVGSAHIQRSGVMQITTPSGSVDVSWLGTRLSRTFEILSIYQNDPANDCVDRIEKSLAGTEEGVFARRFDLRKDALGYIEAFRCEEELPVPYQFIPANYRARDHYDLYLYFPAF